MAFRKARILGFMDGINQRENVDWRGYIDKMSIEIAKIGGRLGTMGYAEKRSA